MPNHVMNIVSFSERLDEIRAFVKSEESIFDFNNIVPEPEGLHDTSTEDGSLPDWYDWRVSNWGTKWNCYEEQEEADGFTFWTAWAMPYQVLLALSDKFPDVRIDVQWADEDMGNNCGICTLLAGNAIEFTPMDGDRAWACELWGYEYEEEEEEEA